MCNTKQMMLNGNTFEDTRCKFEFNTVGYFVARCKVCGFTSYIERDFSIDEVEGVGKYANKYNAGTGRRRLTENVDEGKRRELYHNIADY